MPEPLRTRAAALFCALFFASMATGQDDRSVGGVDFNGLAKATRVEERNYPVSGVAEVFVSHKFGLIKVVSWDQDLIRLRAEIEVGAENSIQAERFAQEIDLVENHVGDRVDIRTAYPAVSGSARLGYTATLELSLPKNVTLKLENSFGDISVVDVEGSVSIDSHFGTVDLHNLSGTVRVQSKGESTLYAERLHQGGVFFLRSTRATFADVSGDLHVNNYLGSVEVRSPGDNLSLDVISESGPIHLYLPSSAKPHVEASVDFGAIESDLLLKGETWGESRSGRSANADATQRFDLYASFDSIFIHQAQAPPPLEGLSLEEGKPFQEIVQHPIAVASGTELFVDATLGDINIRGGEGSAVEVRASKSIRITDVDNVSMALEGLALRVLDEAPDRLTIETVVQDDMTALGCIEYRVDMTIVCPPDTTIHVKAEHGLTSLTGIGGDLYIEQDKGQIIISQALGHVKATNLDGGIDVRDSGGMLDLQGTNGAITVRNADGDVNITGDRSKVVLDAPRAGVTVENRGGDVHVIALEGINGAYDISTENGNISMAIPEESDAWLILSANGGKIDSVVTLMGSTQRDMQSFQGRLNGGKHQVVLATHEGNIVID